MSAGTEPPLVTDDVLDVIAPVAVHKDLGSALLDRYAGAVSGLLLMPPEHAIGDAALEAIVGDLRRR